MFNQGSSTRSGPICVCWRSPPDDKLTWAKGLNSSLLNRNTAMAGPLKRYEQIDIFPDRQVVVMTGAGANGAPVLKNADVGFLGYGHRWRENCKGAAHIILLDDSSASSVVAAKWGRVCSSLSRSSCSSSGQSKSPFWNWPFCALAYIPCPLMVLRLLW